MLKTEKNPNPTASMVPNGYLLMFGKDDAEKVQSIEKPQRVWSWHKKYKGSELSKIFPYINNEGIETATYTDNKSEGWIDPLCFIVLLKVKQ